MLYSDCVFTVVLLMTVGRTGATGCTDHTGAYQYSPLYHRKKLTEHDQHPSCAIHEQVWGLATCSIIVLYHIIGYEIFLTRIGARLHLKCGLQKLSQLQRRWHAAHNEVHARSQCLLMMCMPVADGALLTVKINVMPQCVLTHSVCWA